MTISPLWKEPGLWLIFGSALILLVWTILKIFGVFHTPPLIENVPYITGVISIIGIGIQFGRLLERITILNTDMSLVKGNIRDLEKDTSYIKGKLKISG